MNDLKYFLQKYKYSAVAHDNECICTENVNCYESNDSRFWLINPNQVKIDINLLEKLDNKQFFVHEIEGTWSCIIQDKSTNKFRAISSINNELPWYYSEKSPYIISNNIWLIIKLNGLTDPDEDGIATFISFDHTFAGATFIRGIKKIYGGDIIYADDNSVKIVKDSLPKWLGFDDSIQDPRSLIKYFIDEVDKSLRDPNPEITLTSGADSRIILAAGLLTKRKFKLMTGVAPTTDSLDIKIPAKIAAELKIEHIQTDASKRETGNLEDVIERMAIETNSEFIPRNWIIFYKEYVLDPSLSQRSKLLGYGGEIFKGFYTDLNRTINKRTSALSPKYKTRVTDTVLNTYDIYRNINQRNSLNLFYQRERSHFWVPMNIRTLLSYCKCYSPLMSPILLGLGYRVKGGIECSKIHDLMLETLPETIKNFPTHYTKLEFIRRYIIYTYIKRYSKVDFFMSADFLGNGINYELLKNIVPPEKIKNMLMQYKSRRLNDSVVHKLFAISNFFRIINN